MTGYEYFEEVLKRKGIKAFDVSKGTGIRSGVFSDWKNGRYTPKADKMKIIADYLGVPVEPLLGVQTDEQPKYYYDEATLKLAQELFDNHNLRILLDAAKNIDDKDVLLIYNIIKRMQEANKDE
jgi:transcriptional regulator with XRE-family HTH domain